ncbi:MAG: GNAT family N-acetyltransferase [Acidobacteriaceae bacterium]|nr:GNAT family N-acetyltransferase [Acidobacteriaceae bacterium]
MPSASVETKLNIRAATLADVPLILDFIRSLAEYERAPEKAIATEEDLRRDGFGPEPKFRVVIADWEQRPAGFAFFFHYYSTWRGRPGLYLEDLFVRPEFRGKGIGKALLKYLAGIAVRENCYGMRWQVLDWNTPAIDFYKALGGEVLQEWLTARVIDDALRRLAEGV